MAELIIKPLQHGTYSLHELELLDKRVYDEDVWKLIDEGHKVVHTLDKNPVFVTVESYKDYEYINEYTLLPNGDVVLSERFKFENTEDFEVALDDYIYKYETNEINYIGWH